MRALSIIVAVAWFFSFTRTLLHLRVIPRLRAGEVPLRTPLVSVIVPARNEERVIGQTVHAWRAQTYAPFELVIVNDRSSDGTGEILHAIDDPRLVVVDGEEPPPGWLGKPWALHEGSLRARGELLLFVDADVIYAPEALQALVAYQQRSEARVVALLPHFEMRGFWENAAMPQLALTALTFLPLWLSNRTRIGMLAIGGGPGNLVARSDYDAVGGHEALRDSVIDDIALARLVRRKLRHRTEAIRADDLVSLRMYHGLREIVDGFTKNFFFAFGRSYIAGLLALVAGVVFHILPYFFALRGDPYAIATVVLITLTRLVLFGSLRYSLLAAVFLHPVMLAVWSYITVRSMWYTGVRRRLQWRGRTYDAAESRFGADR
jgi:glycosyltransferase involved in cell wall biosynthesis